MTKTITKTGNEHAEDASQEVEMKDLKKTQESAIAHISQEGVSSLDQGDGAQAEDKPKILAALGNSSTLKEIFNDFQKTSLMSKISYIAMLTIICLNVMPMPEIIKILIMQWNNPAYDKFLNQLMYHSIPMIMMGTLVYSVYIYMVMSQGNKGKSSLYKLKKFGVILLLSIGIGAVLCGIGFLIFMIADMQIAEVKPKRFAANVIELSIMGFCVLLLLIGSFVDIKKKSLKTQLFKIFLVGFALGIFLYITYIILMHVPESSVAKLHENHLKSLNKPAVDIEVVKKILFSL
ncbi:hypothetical protein NEFER03_1985 [Nematocida sp. LUAm3]|nr:hypothetical protein NEFER03_1985 [Nematocida sp. LUAm3]KAI5176069.1 hypothetical protein NEFER02_1903 [Nematocida sp. LUAm2]KAI5177113.1 hypothetical protein NEFER01_0388 [Nematocida sp. LUAm1]